jgi:AcrR family transcriptional regulator
MVTATDHDLRRSVIDVAVGILETEGVGALSMREVARRAGVSHQAPYHHFADRAAILAAVAEEGFTILSNRMHEALAAPGDPMEGCFLAYVRTAIEHPGHFRVMFRPELCTLDDHPSAREAGMRAFEALLQLARRVSRPDADEATISTMSTMLWSQVHGMATLIIDGPLMRTMPETSDLERLVTEVAAFTTRSNRHGIDH